MYKVATVRPDGTTLCCDRSKPYDTQAEAQNVLNDLRYHGRAWCQHKNKRNELIKIVAFDPEVEDSQVIYDS